MSSSPKNTNHHVGSPKVTPGSPKHAPVHTSTPTFDAVAERISFPNEEERMLEYWKQIDAFQTSLKMSAGKKPFVFYDGPPFATGLPHYGHILAGTIKDAVTRFAHQTGHHVERRFGWDCHGLPIEYEIDKMKKLKSRKDVIEWGIGNYNEACRSIVQRYTSEWRDIVTRFGRWIDFDNDYKTMDKSFMESVWWVFNQLFQKGLVYRAFKVMPYSTALATPLSNFETAQCSADLPDPSIVVTFNFTHGNLLQKFPGLKALVWTTTPWTLPSNLALAVNPNLDYVIVQANESTYLCGKDRLDWLTSKLKWKSPKVVGSFKGTELVGLAYEPMFKYFEKTAKPGKAFKVISAEYVTATDGTGIVHQAPAFGEEDFNTCVHHGIIDKTGDYMPLPVDANGCFTNEVPDFVGQHVKEADKGIKEVLKSRGILLMNETEVHSVKVCWRSDTPLIYRAVASWFVKVDGFNDKLVENNDMINWVPGHVGEGRFKNWLADAKDWSVSRNRFWGTPLPIWANEDFTEIKCVGSVAELEQLTGKSAGTVTDIHRHFIDELVVPSEKKPGTFLKRIDEVFDCWFESGAVPYGQVHYPFEKKAEFENRFPADFIAEGLDQTRGWFYTLHVLAHHIFGKPAFKNVIVNGLVLASDGKKMSKRLKNYPDPVEVLKRHGADAVRLYMCNSPVVRAEPLKFKEEGVKDVVKDIFCPLYNSYRFLVQEVTRFETNYKCQFIPNKNLIRHSTNVTDQWIYAAAQSLIEFVRGEMAAYRLYTVAGRVVKFLEDLSNWYIKLNRGTRLRAISDDEDSRKEAEVSLNCLFDVLLDLVILMAPLTPFISESLYLNLAKALPKHDARKQASVHFVMIPEADKQAMRSDIELKVARMQSVVEMGRQLRDKRRVALKTPLKSMTVVHSDPQYLADIKSLETYILEELNLISLHVSNDTSGVEVSVQPNWKVLGEKLGAAMKTLPAALKQLSAESIRAVENGKKVEVAGIELGPEELQVVRKVKVSTDPNIESTCQKDTVVSMDFTEDPELKAMAVCREIRSRAQKLRKAAGINQADPVNAWLDCSSAPNMSAVFNERLLEIRKSMSRPINDSKNFHGHEVIIAKESFECEGETAIMILAVDALEPIEAKIAELTGNDFYANEVIKLYIQGSAPGKCKSLPAINVNGKSYVVNLGQHFNHNQ